MCDDALRGTSLTYHNGSIWPRRTKVNRTRPKLCYAYARRHYTKPFYFSSIYIAMLTPGYNEKEKEIMKRFRVTALCSEIQQFNKYLF